jgi:hypothetical protein
MLEVGQCGTSEARYERKGGLHGVGHGTYIIFIHLSLLLKLHDMCILPIKKLFIWRCL